MSPRLLATVAVLGVFSVYSIAITIEHGYFGFLEVAMREPWAMQMLIDVALAIGCFTMFAIPDAKKHGLTVWPYVIVSIFLGSIGALAYLVHREVVLRRAVRTPALAGR